MDTSAEYVKMCEKAHEIQATKPEVIRPVDFWGIWNGCYPHVWLPRQDQLQEMVKRQGVFHTKAIQIEWIHFRDWIENFIERPTVQNFQQSWEQLWLAFVMKEKFNKTWDGQNWLPIKWD